MKPIKAKYTPLFGCSPYDVTVVAFVAAGDTRPRAVFVYEDGQIETASLSELMIDMEAFNVALLAND